jgi:hypothetical protein
MKNVFTPESKIISYRLNVETGRYEKQPSKIHFSKLPFELKVEKTFDEKIIEQGAREIITGRIVNHRRTFFTGLRTTLYRNWFHGNDYEQKNGVKINSLVIFHFSKNDEYLTIYYFNRWYKSSPRERAEFIRNFISQVLI